MAGYFYKEELLGLLGFLMLGIEFLLGKESTTKLHPKIITGS